MTSHHSISSDARGVLFFGGILLAAASIFGFYENLPGLGHAQNLPSSGFAISASLLGALLGGIIIAKSGDPGRGRYSLAWWLRAIGWTVALPSGIAAVTDLFEPSWYIREAYSSNLLQAFCGLFLGGLVVLALGMLPWSQRYCRDKGILLSALGGSGIVIVIVLSIRNVTGENATFWSLFCVGAVATAGVILMVFSEIMKQPAPRRPHRASAGSRRT